VSEERFDVMLDLETGYEFRVDFKEPGIPALTVDEPPPLGEGHGPNPSRLLATAVASCLSASLLFCLRRSRIDVKDVHATVSGTLARNERGRLRVSGLDVRINVEVAPGDRERMGRCMELFEDFCVVTESVRHGIDVGVRVDVA
jgi:organic hydroperoxide reductase OsmC/OhrA